MDLTWEQEPWELWRFISWSLDFFFLDICFDVSVDVDLDNRVRVINRLYSECIYFVLLNFSTVISLCPFKVTACDADKSMAN